MIAPLFSQPDSPVLHTRIKICGITRVEDALSAAQAGADAIGLVFYPSSPRAVSVDIAREIVANLPPFVTAVGLFVNETASEIERINKSVGLDLLQLHGDETPQFCAALGVPFLKALRVKPGDDVAQLMNAWRDARSILLDAFKPGVPGGTGEVFDWSLVPRSQAGKIVLAGGLTPDNVCGAIQATRVAAVDVSGGVESAPGLKSSEKIAAFVSAVRSADQIPKGE
ncbi:MAG: phosphoribosylanthranilate isomerase [Halioglobus sp.]